MSSLNATINETSLARAGTRARLSPQHHLLAKGCVMATSHPIPTDPRFQDLTGKTFGQWHVLHYAGKNSHRQPSWACRCACGYQATRTGNSLKQGDSLSCGRCQSQPRSPANDNYLRMLILMSCNLSATGCWEWQFTKSGTGYGVIELRKKLLGVHVVSYMLWRGENPQGLFVLHRCDNRVCCNPDHLFLGTNQDNIDDKVSKGRQAKGESLRAAIQQGWKRSGWESRRKVVVK